MGPHLRTKMMQMKKALVGENVATTVVHSCVFGYHEDMT